MITHRQQMFSIVKDLKEESGLIAIKCELESEGILQSELTYMAEIAWKTGLKLYIKIGGCEAVSDLFLCREYSADGIIAPMIESSYAVRKFRKAFENVYKDCTELPLCFINVESESGLKNVDSIISEGSTFLEGITIGRGDLYDSLSDFTDGINGKVLSAQIEILTQKVKKTKLNCTLGGKIRPNSFNFISKFFSSIDCIETRNLVFGLNNKQMQFTKESLRKAIDFEQHCLLHRNYYFNSFISRNQERLDSLSDAEKI